MCDMIRTLVPRCVTVGALAKKFGSSAPLLKYPRRIRILSLARDSGEGKAGALALVLWARSLASPAIFRGRKRRNLSAFRRDADRQAGEGQGGPSHGELEWPGGNDRKELGRSCLQRSRRESRRRPLGAFLALRVGGDRPKSLEATSLGHNRRPSNGTVGS